MLRAGHFVQLLGETYVVMEKSARGVALVPISLPEPLKPVRPPSRFPGDHGKTNRPRYELSSVTVVLLPSLLFSLAASVTLQEQDAFVLTEEFMLRLFLIVLGIEVLLSFAFPVAAAESVPRKGRPGPLAKDVEQQYALREETGLERLSRLLRTQALHKNFRL